jgi:soluble lytic murein transglycosylase-like protein
MLIIMIGVLCIISAMAFVVLPEQSALSSAGVQPAAALAAESITIDTAVAPAVVAAPVVSAALPAAGTIAPLFTPEVQYWASDIARWAAEYDLDPNIIATVMQIESCGNPQAVSGAGARGLFQVMPFHFSATEDMLDPDTNARRGMNFYNEQLRYTGGDKLLSFAGYNGGYAASGGDYATWPNETKRYYEWAKGIYADAQAGAASSATLDAWLAAGGGPGCDIAAANLGMR